MHWFEAKTHRFSDNWESSSFVKQLDEESNELKCEALRKQIKLQAKRAMQRLRMFPQTLHKCVHIFNSPSLETITNITLRIIKKRKNQLTSNAEIFKSCQNGAKNYSCKWSIHTHIYLNELFFIGLQEFHMKESWGVLLLSRIIKNIMSSIQKPCDRNPWINDKPLF